MTISRHILEHIKKQAAAEAPNEACGYLAGAGDVARIAIPMRNVDESPEHYSFDPSEQFAAARRARSEGLELIAVYHSHPATAARMSDEDIRLANDTGVLYLIYSMVDDALKGFRITRDKALSEVPVVVAATAAS